jgi:hypothetical protein
MRRVPAMIQRLDEIRFCNLVALIPVLFVPQYILYGYKISMVLCGMKSIRKLISLVRYLFAYLPLYRVPITI